MGEWANGRANVFVPEGLTDRSLAVYCQGCVTVDGPSRRDGVILRAVILHRTIRRQTILFQSLGLEGERPTKIIPRPYGADPIINRSLAVNCQATISQSLRDKSGVPGLSDIASRVSDEGATSEV